MTTIITAILRTLVAPLLRAARSQAARAEHIERRLREIAPDAAEMWRAGEICEKSAIQTIADHILAPRLGGSAADAATCRSPLCACGWRTYDCLPLEIARRKAARLRVLPRGGVISNVRFGVSHRAVVEAKRAGRTPSGIWIATARVPDGPLLLERNVEL